eukprot:INCI19301.3.p1 GENE.INCI19301.3~~INCI19301.3.p1  ORF type:complete len:153 (-),score=0.56 INCI19301.3:247-705(-)
MLTPSHFLTFTLTLAPSLAHSLTLPPFLALVGVRECGRRSLGGVCCAPPRPTTTERPTSPISNVALFVLPPLRLFCLARDTFSSSARVWRSKQGLRRATEPILQVESGFLHAARKEEELACELALVFRAKLPLDLLSRSSTTLLWKTIGFRV